MAERRSVETILENAQWALRLEASDMDGLSAYWFVRDLVILGEEIERLREAVNAFRVRDELIESMSEDWDALNLAFTRARMANVKVGGTDG